MMRCFDYGATMPVPPDNDLAVARIAAMIGEPARARMLVSLLDGSTRTGAELAMIADVSPSTASVHLHRLEAVHLVQVRREGRNRYYGLAGAQVARVLKDLNAVAEDSDDGAAALDGATVGDGGDISVGRRCYDHLGGDLGIALLASCVASGWLMRGGRRGDSSYQLTPVGISGFGALGIDVVAVRGLRRRAAYGCPDWRDGTHHLGGALGAAITRTALERGWVVRHGNGRNVKLTETGRRRLLDALAATKS
jgi:DNA-binding transcriptional ArsR family regulator